MIIEKTKLDGVYVCTPEPHIDERGFLMETYHQRVFNEAGIMDVFVQDNHSLSYNRNTVRGLHCQWKPPAAKLMRCVRGSVFLVAVDIRKNSPTLGQWIGIEASAENKKQLYAPAGFVRGYQTLEDNCEVHYKVSDLYDPTGQGEVAWNDPDIGIVWPITEPPLLSPRSQNTMSFADWLKDPRSDTFK